MTKKHRKLKIVLGIVILVIAAILVIMGIYLSIYYHSVDTDAYFEDTDTVTVTETESGWLFDGDGADAALIFYPGAKMVS